jgi:hypothetical protein
LELLEMHIIFSYKIALHYVLDENFHTLKSHVTIPSFFLVVSKRIPEGFKFYRIQLNMTF